MTIQFMHSFDELGTNGALDPEVLGFTSSTPGAQFQINSAGYLRGQALSLAVSGSPSFSKPIVDDNKISFGFNFFPVANFTAIPNLISLSGPGISYSFSAINVITGSNSKQYCAIYKNGVELARGTTAIYDSTVLPAVWSHIELTFDKIALTLVLRLNESVEISTTLDPALVFNTFSLNMGGSQIPLMDDLVFYSAVGWQGINKVDGYKFTSVDTQTFTDNSDFGHADTTTMNNASNIYQYRASATSGQEDLFNYNNILPDTVVFQNIKGIEISNVVSAGTYDGGNLKSVIKIGSTEYTNDISAMQFPFQASLANTIYEKSPATSLEWTKAELQAIKTGYKI